MKSPPKRWGWQAIWLWKERVLGVSEGTVQRDSNANHRYISLARDDPKDFGICEAIDWREVASQLPSN